MTDRVVIALPGNKPRAEQLARRIDARLVPLVHRRFPDGESYLRIEDRLDGAQVALVTTLDRPDGKIPSLLFAADLVRDLGAARVGLVCPYLPYMRQDCRFHPGEALTSVTFARWLSVHLDWLITVDPHLHRYRSLSEIYRLETRVVAAAPALAEWIDEHVYRPVVVGPDEESAQWVRAVAGARDLPWRVMTKQRHGDRDVRVTAPDLQGLEGYTPVLVDDIVSSGATLADAARVLIAAGLAPPVCAIVHGLFGKDSRRALTDAGIETLACTDSVDGPEARIALMPLIAPVAREMMDGNRQRGLEKTAEPPSAPDQESLKS